MSISPILFPETSNNNRSEIHAPAYTATPFEPPALRFNPWAVVGLCILALSAAATAGVLFGIWVAFR